MLSKNEFSVLGKKIGNQKMDLKRHEDLKQELAQQNLTRLTKPDQDWRREHIRSEDEAQVKQNYNSPEMQKTQPQRASLKHWVFTERAAHTD